MELAEFVLILVIIVMFAPIMAFCVNVIVEQLYKEHVLDKVKITLDEGAKMPTRAHKADAGFDLYAMQDIYVMPQGRITADTGVHIEIPEGYFGDIRPKSGLLFNHNLFTAGTVDSGYRGAVKVRIINFGSEPYQFRKGEKIAQMVLMPCLTPALEEVEKLSETERGNGGFGSTGR